MTNEETATGATGTGSLLDVTKLVNPNNVKDERVKEIFGQLLQGFGKVLPVYRAKGLVDDPKFMQTYHGLIMNKFMPKNIDFKTLMLLEFASDVAARWEYCVVGAYQMCLAVAGVNPEEVNAAIKLVTVAVGMSYLEASYDVYGAKKDSSDFRRLVEINEVSDQRIKTMYEEVKEFFGVVPELYRVKCLVDDPDYLQAFHSALMEYTKPSVLDLKTMHLILIVALTIMRNGGAVKRHSDAAMKAGATAAAISETIRGCYVNAAVFSTAAGFAIFGYPKD